MCALQCIEIQFAESGWEEDCEPAEFGLIHNHRLKVWVLAMHKHSLFVN